MSVPFAQIIIDHGDGGEVDVIAVNPSSKAAKHAEAHPTRKVVDVPQDALDAELATNKPSEQQEKSAAAKVAKKMLRNGSAAAILGVGDKHLTPEQRAEKEKKRREKLKRDDWCRRERHYHDEDQGKQGKGREWIEGDKVSAERVWRELDVESSSSDWD